MKILKKKKKSISIVLKCIDKALFKMLCYSFTVYRISNNVGSSDVPYCIPNINNVSSFYFLISLANHLLILLVFRKI